MTKQVSRFVIEGNPCVIEFEVKPAQLIGHGRTVDLEPIPPDAVEVSICGTFDGSSGQCVADIRAATDDADVIRLCELWERWHLNGLKAGCRIQEAWLAEHMPSGDYEARKAALAAAGWEPAQVEVHPPGGSPTDKRGSHFTSYSYGSAWLFEPVPPAVIEELRALLKSLSGRRIGPAPDLGAVLVAAETGGDMQTNATQADDQQHPCPNCGQWARPWRGFWDCFNECNKRGFVAATEGEICKHE